jgi:hypothetical protein
MYFVFTYENKIVKPVEIVLTRDKEGRKNDGGDKSN